MKKLCHSKILDPKEVGSAMAILRHRGRTIATVNGSFDLLHAGHLYILEEGAKQADIFVVALNSDASISRYKGEDRPIIPLQYRLQLIAALECVDYVTWFDEDDPRELLKKIAPDVHVNGAEYGINCIESDTVLEGGGSLHIVDRLPSLATSDIIKKIISLSTTQQRA